MLNRASERAREAERKIKAATGADKQVETIDCDLTSFASTRAAIAAPAPSVQQDWMSFAVTLA